MLAIRLQRVGRKKQPLYRVVVSEKSKDTYGNHLEILGNYNPHKKEAVLKEDRIKHWLSVGAQASNTVNNLFIKEGVIEGKKAKSVRITKTRQAKQNEKNKADTEAKAKEAEPKVEEQPVVEEKNEEVKEEQIKE
ncbi:30S ribosomal protein S16 [Patescibacteria group bacterium]|nr:30S ribosomal protein S16 [Patescibacteria group bacterium]